ncbi:DNA polymerase III subunit delta' [Falsigemmobacter intermedius]|uniref:DNA polymerase III subunit delta n=1 Tax=Falsigemmobacter intermedius TaxID=1553448 RepID=A0A3S3YL31_9RHOB|nr:DNA polymerase III subunit delta' [Falsigemmobacter intermedius]RWY42153.1 DNA polymerase III subunit delta' [Falsigemmobacter intermedius]
MARDPHSDDLPEPDRTDGAPHPRDVHILRGQPRAEAAFLEAFNSGRLHHGWLLTGPKGVGKATLAWRIARFLLSQPGPEAAGGFFAPEPPRDLSTPPESPVSRRLSALSEPRLFLLRRAPNDKGDALSRDITVGEVRKLKSFFALSSADGGRRVAIVDAADDMNPAAANALLKLLEEPPEGAVILLISHQPAKLLPTIRSRCRVLSLAPLGPEDVGTILQENGIEAEDPIALAELSGGSAGAALRIAALDGEGLYARLIRLFSTLPDLARSNALAIAEATAGRGKEGQFDLTLELIDLFLARLARAGATRQLPPEAAEGEGQLFARLCPDPATARTWAELAQTLGIRARQGRAVNLDPAALVMDMFLKINDAAKGLRQ